MAGPKDCIASITSYGYYAGVSVPFTTDMSSKCAGLTSAKGLSPRRSDTSSTAIYKAGKVGSGMELSVQYEALHWMKGRLSWVSGLAATILISAWHFALFFRRSGVLPMVEVTGGLCSSLTALLRFGSYALCQRSAISWIR